MNPKTQTLMISIARLYTVGLIAALAGCVGGGKSAIPLPGNSTNTVAAPGIAAEITAHATTASSGGPIPTPAGTQARADEIAQEFIAQYGLVTSMNDCPSIEDPSSDCYVLEDYGQITHLAWEELLPKTRFYLVRYTDYVGDPPTKLSYLFVEQGGQRYTPQTYDLLLEANRIVVTDNNRELIARAWALMVIPGYLGEEVTFVKWEKVSYTAEQTGYPYNCHLQGWTRLGGWEVDWWYVFGSARLEIASGPSVGESGIGDYIEQFDSGYPTGFYDSFQDCIFLGR